jgi:hypothetical protein
MATGNYKDGVKIDLVYQAAALLSNAIPEAIVYDETDTLDTAKSTSLTAALATGQLSGLAIGSYRGFWTPDAEGAWTIMIEDKNNDGQVTKIYNVAGHDMDSVGDLVEGLGAGSVASQLIIHETGMNSQVVILVDGVKSAVSTSLASAVVINESGVKSHVVLMESGVKSHVDTALAGLSSPGMIS